jgi:hypothetical protein
LGCRNRLRCGRHVRIGDIQPEKGQGRILAGPTLKKDFLVTAHAVRRLPAACLGGVEILLLDMAQPAPSHSKKNSRLKSGCFFVCVGNDYSTFIPFSL